MTRLRRAVLLIAVLAALGWLLEALVAPEWAQLVRHLLQALWRAVG